MTIAVLQDKVAGVEELGSRNSGAAGVGVPHGGSVDVGEGKFAVSTQRNLGAAAIHGGVAVRGPDDGVLLGVGEPDGEAVGVGAYLAEAAREGAVW
ncbi:hypothetical protein MUK42_36224 [Musa troglodytarum]|uniref:Uncharacterized protein n=1 Tax=Musa troglodytarum TaxID=320322 RepID=A0A9E7FL15_9LILI|nr:hypothetical protein MUK42_36224 [Musa troglodytarum]